MSQVGERYTWMPERAKNEHERLQFSGISDAGIHAFSQEQWSALKKTTRLRLWFTYKKIVDPDNSNKVRYISRKSVDRFLQSHKESLPINISLSTAKKMILSGKIKEFATTVDRPVLAYYEPSRKTQKKLDVTTLYTTFKELEEKQGSETNDWGKTALEEATKGILNFLEMRPTHNVDQKQVLAHILATSEDPLIQDIATSIDQRNYMRAVTLLLDNKYTVIGHLQRFRPQVDRDLPTNPQEPLRASSIPIAPGVNALSPAAQELVTIFKSKILKEIPLGTSDYSILRGIRTLIQKGALRSENDSDNQKVLELIAHEERRINALVSGKKEPKIPHIKIAAEQFTFKGGITTEWWKSPLELIDRMEDPIPDFNSDNFRRKLSDKRPNQQIFTSTDIQAYYLTGESLCKEDIEILAQAILAPNPSDNVNQTFQKCTVLDQLRILESMDQNKLLSRRFTYSTLLIFAETVRNMPPYPLLERNEILQHILTEAKNGSPLHALIFNEIGDLYTTKK